jgi:hypothetical protein
MSMLPSVPGFRSNKGVTSKIVRAVVDYVAGSRQTYWCYGNSTVEVDEESSLTVTIGKNPIMKITKNNENDLDRIYVFAGNHYDKYGNPTDTTKERLNGILDALGYQGVIPNNVRVFFDPNEDRCYFGRFDEKVALHRDYCVMASIEANPYLFKFDEMMIVPRKTIEAKV